MATIITRSGKGSPLTNTEVDNNFTNLNSDKLESGGTVASLTLTSADINGGTIDGTVIGGASAAAATFTDVTANGAINFTGATVSNGGSVATVDINGGTIDGAVIGGSTPAAISGTTGTFSGNLTVDTNTLFVDAANNRVGVGTTGSVTSWTSGVVQRLQIAGSESYPGLSAYAYKDTSLAYPAGMVVLGRSGSATQGTLAATISGNALGYVSFEGVNTGSTAVSGSYIRGRQSGSAGASFIPGALDFLTSSGSAAPVQRMLIGDNGDISFYEDTGTTPKFFWDASAEALGIGTTSPSALLDVQSAETFVSEFTSTNASNTAEVRVRSAGGAGSNTRGRIIGGYDAGGSEYGGYLAFNTTSTSNVNTERMRIDSSGNVTITGSLSKGSGSFKIDHPIKPETHHLVHSFIEGPQADNIYRGKVTLADGKATVNLDEAGRMTEGTFVALNGNVQCFTTNEDGWTAVRGKINGNILTIEAQDATCADTVSWLVIGERHDQHMIEANWTDDQGRIITEPEKGIA